MQRSPVSSSTAVPTVSVPRWRRQTIEPLALIFSAYAGFLLTFGCVACVAVRCQDWIAPFQALHMPNTVLGLLGAVVLHPWIASAILSCPSIPYTAWAAHRYHRAQMSVGFSPSDAS